MKIKLTCSLCGGEVTYVAKGPADAAAQDKAHASLHKKDCAYAASKERLDWVAEHGSPVDSEVLESEVAI